MTDSNTPIRDAALRDFIASRNTPATKETYQRILKRFMEHIGDKELLRVTYSDLVAYKDSLAHLSARTIHIHVVVLKTFFGFCIWHDLVDKDPSIKLKSPKIHRRPPEFLTEQEANRLMSSIDRSTLFGKRDHAIVSILLSTGIRVGEIVYVRLSDFFLDDAGDVFLNVLRGKGGKARRVKLPAESYAAVQEFTTAICRMQPLGPRSMPLCLRLHGHMEWTRGNVPFVRLSTRQVQHLVAAAGTRAGIEKRVSPHLLRHTCFTLEMLGGANLMEIKEQAGHDYLGTTQQYLHLIDNMKHNAVNRNPLFLRARPHQAKEHLKRTVVDRLERLGVGKRALEVIREELCLGRRPQVLQVDTEAWMPMSEAIKAVEHLNRSPRSARRSIETGGARTLVRENQSWVWREQVLELVEDFITLQTASKRFEVSERTLRRWTRDGTLTPDTDFRTWGGKWIFRYSSLVRHMSILRPRKRQNADIQSKSGRKNPTKKSLTKRPR